MKNNDDTESDAQDKKKGKKNKKVTYKEKKNDKWDDIWASSVVQSTMTKELEDPDENEVQNSPRPVNQSKTVLPDSEMEKDDVFPDDDGWVGFALPFSVRHEKDDEMIEGDLQSLEEDYKDISGTDSETGAEEERKKAYKRRQNTNIFDTRLKREIRPWRRNFLKSKSKQERDSLQQMQKESRKRKVFNWQIPELWRTDELQTGKTVTLGRRFERFCNDTDVHGCQYIMGYEIGILRRGLWAILVLACIGLALWWCTRLFLRFRSADVFVAEQTHTAPLNKVVFPSVIICNVNPLQKSSMLKMHKEGSEGKMEHMWRLVEEEFVFGREHDISPEDQRFLQDFLSRKKFVDLYDRFIKEEISHHSVKKKRSSNFSSSTVWLYDTDRFFQKFYSLPSEQFPHTVPSREALFPFFVRQYGLGNMIMYYDWKFYGILLERSFGTDYGICDRVTPLVHPAENPGDISSIKPGAYSGANNGLTLILDAEVYNYGSSLRPDEGFRLAIADKWDMPLIQYSGMSVGTGRDVRISVSPWLVNTTKNCKDRFPPVKRRCYFNEEIELPSLPGKHGFRYKMSSCLFEAAIQKIRATCDCVPSFHNDPEYKGFISNPCIGKKLMCMNQVIAKLGEYKTVKIDGVEKPCLAACEDQVHRLQMSHMRFPNAYSLKHRIEFCIMVRKFIKNCKDAEKRKSLDMAYKDNAIYGVSYEYCDMIDRLLQKLSKEEFCPSKSNLWDRTRVRSAFQDTDPKFTDKFEEAIFFYMQKNVVVVTVYLRDPFVREYLIDEEMPKVDFLANVGGLFGLFIGVSVISLFEILYHVIMAGVDLVGDGVRLFKEEVERRRLARLERAVVVTDREGSWFHRFKVVTRQEFDRQKEQERDERKEDVGNEKVPTAKII